MKAHIAVLNHERQPRALTKGYMIGRLATIWESWGHTVTFLWGADEFVPADLLVMHVDLSVVPSRYIELAKQYPRVMNGRCVDIRKSTFSEILVDEHSDWTGPVMVKSDLNSEGRPEQHLGEPWPGADEGPVYGKPLGRTLYQSYDKVPMELRGCRDVVIERFVPERLPDCRYGVRFHLKLGDRRLSLRQSADHFIVRTEYNSSLTVAEPDPCADEWCRERRLDFGKLDYVVHDGTPFLLDVNKTQGPGLLHKYPDTLLPHLPNLASGIRSFLVS
jgi:hypothetical protein